MKKVYIFVKFIKIFILFENISPSVLPNGNPPPHILRSIMFRGRLSALPPKYANLFLILIFHKKFWNTSCNLKKKWYNRKSEIWNQAIPAGEIAVPCTCNPLQQGWFPLMRVGFVWSAPYQPCVDGWVLCNWWLWTMSGGEPSSIKQFNWCATRQPAPSKEYGGAWKVHLESEVYGLILYLTFTIENCSIHSRFLCYRKLRLSNGRAGSARSCFLWR